MPKKGFYVSAYLNIVQNIKKGRFAVTFVKRYIQSKLYKNTCKNVLLKKCQILKFSFKWNFVTNLVAKIESNSPRFYKFCLRQFI